MDYYQEKYRYPRIKVNVDEALAICLKLCKAGYGSPMEIMSWPSEVVLSAIEYESFSIDLEAAFRKMNENR